jgi:cation diffusion facilitator CzcD-associated flavoprotein CzcO
MVGGGDTAEQIINKLREVEVMLSQRTAVTVGNKKIGLAIILYTAEEKNAAVKGVTNGWRLHG